MKIGCTYYFLRGLKLKNKKFGLSAILAITIGVVVFAFDLITKYVVLSYLPEEGMTADFLPGFMNFEITRNPGGGWGIFSDQPVLLIVLSIVLISIFIAYFVLQHIKGVQPVSKLLGVAMGFIAGGCFGNLYDRFVFGQVRDFLHFQFMPNFPVFNIADVCLCIGLALAIIYFLFIMPKEGKKGEKSDEK